MDAAGGTFVAQIAVMNLIVNCPLFVALTVGLTVGAAAFGRGDRLAGSLACIGFAVLGLLLLLSTFLGSGQIAMLAQGQGMAPAQIGLLTTGIGCVRSLAEMAGLLCIVGAIAAYVFRSRQGTGGQGMGEEGQP